MIFIKWCSFNSRWIWASLRIRTNLGRADKYLLCPYRDKLFVVSVLPVRTIVNTVKALASIWLLVQSLNNKLATTASENWFVWLLHQICIVSCSILIVTGIVQESIQVSVPTVLYRIHHTIDQGEFLYLIAFRRI